MQDLFDFCCEVMAFFGKLTGFSYKEINALVFVFLLPMLDFILLFFFLKFYFQYREKCKIIHQFQQKWKKNQIFCIGGLTLRWTWLHIMADSLGISYEEMNIWLYVIVQPIVTIVLGIGCWWFYQLNWKKKKELVALFQQKKNENSIN